MKLVHGVGINDAHYNVQVYGEDVNGKRKLIFQCPFWRTWSHMLERCYSKHFHCNRPTYKDCTVCDEWLIFSNFKAWMQTQDWTDNFLDKDILIPGNKVYSPETCVFVSYQVNNFVIENNSTRGEFPIGVYWNKNAKKFIASCAQLGGKRKHLGVFDTPSVAHQAWLKEKRRLSHILASKQSDTRVAEALINRYKNYNSL